MRFTLLAAALLLALTAPLAQAPASHTHLVIVVDGLRPDNVTPEVMPRLYRLGRRGIVFGAHHSVFPTVTRVNASSFVTGTYPETHGLLGNTIFIPSVDATRGLDTGERKNLERVARAEGRLLTAPTLGELLQRSGMKLLGVSSGSTGSAFLLNHTVSGGAIIHTDYTLPPSLGAEVEAALGPAPPHATPNDAQNQRAIDAYLKVGLDTIHPDVTLMWLNDPDGSAHEYGIGAPITRTSLSLVDGGIGRIEDTLRAKGLVDRTNIIVTSDHGFSTHTGEFNAGITRRAVCQDDGGWNEGYRGRRRRHLRASRRTSEGERDRRGAATPARGRRYLYACRGERRRARGSRPGHSLLTSRDGTIRAPATSWCRRTGPAPRTAPVSRARRLNQASQATARRVRTTSTIR